MLDRDRDLEAFCDKPLVCTCACGVLARKVIEARDAENVAHRDFKYMNEQYRLLEERLAMIAKPKN